MLSAKQSHNKVIAENRDLKAYIQNLKQHFQREQQKQQVQFIEKQRDYYRQKKRTPKKYKKVKFEEEDESEAGTEIEEYEESENQEIEHEPEIKKSETKRKKPTSQNIYEYINKNAERYKQ